MIDKFERIWLFIIIVLVLQLLFIGVSTFAHELTHKFDYRNIEKTNERVCVFKNCDDGAVGSYSFCVDDSQLKETQKISKYTEINASLVSLSFVFLFFLLVLIFGKIMIKEVKK